MYIQINYLVIKNFNCIPNSLCKKNNFLFYIPIYIIFSKLYTPKIKKYLCICGFSLSVKKNIFMIRFSN